MINWISADNPPKCSMYKRYLVTVEYKGKGSICGRKTMCMTFEEKGSKRIPTWCWNDEIAAWKVLFYAEFPEPCQD